MARKYLEDALREVSVQDIKNVHLPTARALLSEEARKAGIASGKANMLSESVKFDKPYPGLTVVQRGMYLMPAGKGGCADACRDKTAGCSAACLHNTGRLNLAHQVARTNTLHRDPAAGLALIADELHTHAEKTLRQGGVPSGRLDATSELHIEDMPAGEYIWGGPGGKYQETRGASYPKEMRGIPLLIGSEYGKRYAKKPLTGKTPEPGQPNVYRVPSWSEGLTRGRALQLIGEGHDIATPVTNVPRSAKPERMLMQFGTGEEPLELPVSDFDEHDITYLRQMHKSTGEQGHFGLLREKKPSFGRKREEGTEAAAARFLRPHPVVSPLPEPRRRGRR